MLTVITIGASIVALILSYIYYKYVIFDFWRKKGVFYIEPIVPTGNITDFITGRISAAELFQDIYMKYKHHRFIGTYTFFKPNLVVTDLNLIQTVLTKEFGSFHDRGWFCNEKTDPLSGHLFLLPGEKWRNLRVKLTPTFTSGKIKQMFMVVKECSEDLTKYLENELCTGNTIEIKELAARYTTDVIMSTAFGMKSNCIAEGENEYRYWGRKFFEVNIFWNAMFMFTPQFYDFFSIPYTDPGVAKFFTKLFRDNMEYRKMNNIVRYDFMNLLVEIMNNGYVAPDRNKATADALANKSKLTMLEACAQAFLFYVAGSETSSTVLTHCLYELAQHDDMQDKIRQEIDEIVKKHDGLSYDAVNEMTYLHKVIQETMRKYPPAPVLNRICTKDIILPTTNVHVSKGTLITIPVLGVHRDPSIYPDPEKFDPERFNADQVSARHSYSFLSFGQGPRICIGTRFGYLQTKMGVINILSKFKLKLHPQTPVPLNFDKSKFILFSKSCVQLIIEPL